MALGVLKDDLEKLAPLAIVVRRQWALLAAGVAIGTCAAVIHAARQPAVYAGTAEVSIGNEPWRSLLPGEFSPASPYTERMTFDSQPLIIRSEPVAARAAHNLGFPDGSSGMVRSSLHVEKIEGTRLVSITAEAESAAKAQGIANAVADAYIQVTGENRAGKARDSIRWLENQLTDYEAKVQRSHQALIDYVEKQNLTQFGPIGENPQGNGSGAATPLGHLKQEKIDAELELDRLSQRYGELHPELVQKRNEVKRLAGKIAEEEKVLRENQKKGIGYEILAGKARADLELYGVLVKKLEQANISGSLTEDSINVVQYAALPTAPIRPNRPMIVLLGLAAGLFFGTGLAFLRESLDQRILGPKQIEEISEVPILGSIPDIGKDEQYGTHGALHLFSPTATAGSESFRTLRANVKFSMVGLEKRVIVLTSCSPGEGKTTVTANLGAALCGAGQRVVVVDADLRRPALHHHFGVASTRGLSTLIAGDDRDLDSVIVRGANGRPDFLPAGPCPPNPGDFLESPTLGKTLDALRERYDIVLVDSAPGSMVADAQVLGLHAGGVIVVARAGVAERGSFVRLVGQLRQGGCKILGCVINGVEPQNSYYAYGYGYGSGYGPKRDAEGLEHAGEPLAGSQGRSRV